MSKRKLTFAAKTREIMMEDKFYWYGIAAAVYIVTCWVFSVHRKSAETTSGLTARCRGPFT